MTSRLRGGGALLFVFVGVVSMACGGEAGQGPPEPVNDGGPPGDSPTAADVPTVPMTWMQLYATYFGPNTPGHCGKSVACHLQSQGGFMCGSTPDSCYKGLVTAFLVDPAHPTMSAIADPNQSPLSWFGGNMPQDMPVPNAQAKADVAAWVAAGAQEN
jgi:hypothetical protein